MENFMFEVATFLYHWINKIFQLYFYSDDYNTNKHILSLYSVQTEKTSLKTLTIYIFSTYITFFDLVRQESSLDNPASPYGLFIESEKTDLIRSMEADQK